MSPLPWVCFKNFNLVALTDEKRGGNPRNQSDVEAFREVLFRCNLFDMNYSDNMFMWWNKQIGEASVEAKLDQFVMTPSWLNLIQEWK